MAAHMRSICKLKAPSFCRLTQYSRLQRSSHLVYSVNKLGVANKTHLSSPFYSFSQRFLSSNVDNVQQRGGGGQQQQRQAQTQGSAAADDETTTPNSLSSGAADDRLDRVEYNRKKQKEKLERKKAKRLAHEQKMKEKAATSTEAVYDAQYSAAERIPGDKKDISSPLHKRYSPQYVEAAWYDWWEQKGFFKPEVNPGPARFTVCLPPPNVTGDLHLGHALTSSIQDAIVRWRRMCGDRVLWNPGCDHAGIATQVVVEKQLMKQTGLTRHDIGRRQFIDQVWQWKNQKGDHIYAQMRKLGSSLDWDRDCFTMDPKHSSAVVEAFVRLHERGLIYRSNRLVNWSCSLKSAISDIEVDDLVVNNRTKLEVPGYTNKIEFGTLTSFAYKVIDSDELVVVATTRLETMLGDTAVAVHPDDNRYSHLRGRELQHPFCDRKLPIVFDDFVDRLFGTGVVKLTPGHSHVDYEVARRHGLPVVSILDDAGLINDVCPQFQGVKRFDARAKIQNALKELGLYVGAEDHSMTLPICSRSGDIIEPVLREQWFVDCSMSMDRARDVVNSCELQLIPDHHENIWNEWLKAKQDWCISRQLWWGHQIPAYRVMDATGKRIKENGVDLWVSGKSLEEATLKAANLTGLASDQLQLIQDEDVLDTWFSSAIFPLSMLGWPDSTDDLQQYYPTNILETGSDILFFWVARMVMLCQELHGSLPFKKVLLHGLLRDVYGRKMSKSLGNVINPIHVIQGVRLKVLNAELEKSNLPPSEIDKAMAGQKRQFPHGIKQCGADALRFTLCSYNFKNQNINFNVDHAVYNRNFCNKIWQAFRFFLQNIPADYEPSNVTENVSAIDNWILIRMSELVDICNAQFNNYNLHLVCRALNRFWFEEFCDVYLECIKPTLLTDTESARVARDVMYTVFDNGLRALSPFMPYLTEELYQRLPGPPSLRAESIMIAPYPTPTEFQWQNVQLEQDLKYIQSIATVAMNLRRDFNFSNGRTDLVLSTSDPTLESLIQKYEDIVLTMMKSRRVVVEPASDHTPDGCITRTVDENTKMHLNIKAFADPVVEIARVKLRLSKLDDKIDREREMLNDVDIDLVRQVALQQSIAESEQAKKHAENHLAMLEKLT
ncbi:valine--tRNA ligase-like [Tubulanus polymorphus]|uniref:valine--tRNA ligase-like n=1 Tax=Tubulanus polymorphus TaxID=672921 RepID=UPI003DA1DF72